MLLKCVAGIEQQMDEHFDPAHVPQSNVVPPSETGLRPGSDPALIKDDALA